MLHYTTHYTTPHTDTGPVFSKKITSYVRIFVNMQDFYLAAKIRNFVFSKALRIFAAKNLTYGNLARFSLRCNGHDHGFVKYILPFSSAHMFWQ